ncbi:ATP-binding protein [Streptomyces sp. NPDC088725]|uniref:ATP-binding protein n=1 Tax=Streptomyces sp. NPDC088725 TaxID=3365873 RepID=UPI0037F7C289
MESHGSVPAGPLWYVGDWRFTAPAVDASVPRARHTVRDLLKQRRVPARRELVQCLLLIVSELVTDAVRHAGPLSPDIAVGVTVTEGWVRLSVEDGRPHRPAADRARTEGRGLLLVREIVGEAAGGFGAEHTTEGGKVIWAALPLMPPLGGCA